jgi:hypothetical protein
MSNCVYTIRNNKLQRNKVEIGGVRSILKDENVDSGLARWKNSNGQKYLEIFAPDHYQLGVLEGNYLSKQIKSFKRVIKFLSLTFKSKEYSYKKLIELSKGYEPFIPDRFLLEMEGMAESVNKISFDDILLQNCFFDIFYGKLIPKFSNSIILKNFEIACTSFAVRNKRRTLIAQNFDVPFFFKRSAAFVYVHILGNSSFFSLRLGAQLSLPVAINSFGVSVRINAIKSYRQAGISIPSSIRVREGLEKAKTAQAFFNYVTRRDFTASCNLLISDLSTVFALEVVPYRYEKREIKECVSKSNTFISDSLQISLIKPKYSKRRQKYADRRIKSEYEKSGGHLKEKSLLRILKDNYIICRRNFFRPITLAYLTDHYFGIGNPRSNPSGVVPIFNSNNLII